jgi:Bacterial protein of unknown function (DUF937)
MPGLFDLVSKAQDGKAIAALAREFGLSPQQTEAGVMALLPAISAGLKRSTATPEGLGNLLAVMGRQQDLQGMHDDPKAAFAPQGRDAGNDVLSVLFGSPEVSRAVVDQAQQFSGVSSSILKKLLPVIAGMLISGLMGGKSGKAAAPQGSGNSPGMGGALGEILGQIFGRGLPGGSSPPPTPQQIPSGQSIPIPNTPGGQTVPDGDLLGYILSELQKGLKEGRIKPVIIGGPVQMPMPGGQGGPVQLPSPDQQAGPPAGPQVPGGDILGQILRDLLGGARGPLGAPQQRTGASPELKDLSDRSKQLGVMDNVGAAVFGDQFEVGRNVDSAQMQSMQNVLDRFFGRG